MSKTSSKEEQNLFVSAILSKPGLSMKDREKVLMLLARDLEDEIRSDIRDIVLEELAVSSQTMKSNIVEELRKKTRRLSEQNPTQEWIHDPKKVNSFLMSFSSDRSYLKYSVHDWENGEFDGFKYDVFISRINKIKTQAGFKDLYRCNLRLYYALTDYLLSSDKKPGEFYWDKDHKIKVGLQYPEGCAQKWMSENPEHQLWDMPLTAIPEEFRPKFFEGRQLANMGDIRDLFKHVIEFRDDKQDFLKLIRTTFSGNADFHVDYEDKDFESIRFYTFTTPVSNALMAVVENIRCRSKSGADKVSITVENNTTESFELHIKHLGSFPNSDINDVKLKDGTFASMRKRKDSSGSLLSVCDYCVIGQYKGDDGELGTYRISYLYPKVEADTDGHPKVLTEKIDEKSDGFEYIFKFYKNNAEENPNS